MRRITVSFITSTPPPIHVMISNLKQTKRLTFTIINSTWNIYKCNMVKRDHSRIELTTIYLFIKVWNKQWSNFILKKILIHQTF